MGFIEESDELISILRDDDIDSFNSLYNTIKKIEFSSLLGLKHQILSYLISLILSSLFVALHKLWFFEFSIVFIFIYSSFYFILRLIIMLINYNTSLLYLTWPIFITCRDNYSFSTIKDEICSGNFSSMNNYIRFLIHRFSESYENSQYNVKCKFRIYKKMHIHNLGLIYILRKIISSWVIKSFIFIDIILYILFLSIPAYRVDIFHLFLVILIITVNSVVTATNKYKISEYSILYKNCNTIKYQILETDISSFNQGTFLSYINIT